MQHKHVDRVVEDEDAIVGHLAEQSDEVSAGTPANVAPHALDAGVVH